MSIRILLADDHKIMCDGLCALLRKHPEMEVVGQASDGRSAVNLVQELMPDVVLMDISTPNLNGIKTTQKMIAMCPDIKIMAFTAHSSKSMVVEMLVIVSFFTPRCSEISSIDTHLSAIIDNP